METTDITRAKARDYYRRAKPNIRYSEKRKIYRRKYTRLRESVARPCARCGEYFKGLLKPSRPQKFCSRDCFNAHGSAKRRERLASLNVKIRNMVRCRIRAAIKFVRTKKANKTISLLGCSIDFVRGYLEARFQPGMTWANYGKGEGKWEIDHHIPCAEFDLCDPDQQRQCFHYSNLRPLWGKDNTSKGAKRPPTHQSELI